MKTTITANIITLILLVYFFIAWVFVSDNDRTMIIDAINAPDSSKYKQLYIDTKNELKETQDSLRIERIENDTLTVRLDYVINNDLKLTKKQRGL